MEIFNRIKNANDAIGPGFCVLKWWHQEMHLAEGINMSCYHCPPHNLSLDEDLHNTSFKKEQRKVMLEGGKPDECTRCWDLEDIGQIASPRQVLSTIHLKEDKNIITSTASIPWNTDVYPKYLELSFSNTCQLKCSYCAPQKSSSWYNEMKKHGNYDLSPENKKQYDLNAGWTLYEEETNPFIKKFWEWFPDAYDNLHTLRVTGGEPFLSEHTYKLIDYIKANPKENLKFHVNSNLCVSTKKIQKYIDSTKDFKYNKVYVSIDSWGEQAEWIRHGLKLDLFNENLQHILDSGIDVGFMITFCLLSIPKFDLLLRTISELKKRYPNQIHIDTPHMTEPVHLSALIADDDMKKMLDNHYNLMKSLNFEEAEIAKFKTCIEWIKNTPINDIKTHRKDFVKFVEEHDRRRNTNWHKSFPELKNFYRLCNAR